MVLWCIQEENSVKMHSRLIELPQAEERLPQRIMAFDQKVLVLPLLGHETESVRLFPARFGIRPDYMELPESTEYGKQLLVLTRLLA